MARASSRSRRLGITCMAGLSAVSLAAGIQERIKPGLKCDRVNLMLECVVSQVIGEREVAQLIGHVQQRSGLRLLVRDSRLDAEAQASQILRHHRSHL